MKGNQLHPVPLGQVSFTAGSNSTVKFDRALNQLGGRLAHLRKLTMTCVATPTLGAGTATVEELQAAVKNIIIKDSVRELFRGSFKSLRLFEALENGRILTPEPDPAATTEPVVFTRVFDLALPQFEDPTDFLQLLSTFVNGSIYFGYGALTDIDAQCTGLTMTIDVVAWVTILDDIIVPPLLERGEQDVLKSVGLDAEALYAFLAVCDTSAFGAIATNDITAIDVGSEGFKGEEVSVRALLAGYFHDMQVGQFSQVQGEPAAATDDAPKVSNGTALAAADSRMQPVVWSPKGARISKIVHSARPKLTLKWSGTQSTLYALYSRILPRDTPTYGKYLASMKTGLPIEPGQWALKTKTIAKREYVGPRKEYMPVKLKAPGR